MQVHKKLADQRNVPDEHTKRRLTDRDAPIWARNVSPSLASLLGARNECVAQIDTFPPCVRFAPEGAPTPECAIRYAESSALPACC